MPTQFFDTLTMDAPRLTRENYLVSEVRAGRTGIQTYLGSEIGIPDKELVRVYRPPEEVFQKDAIGSFTSLPITVNHPPQLVDSKNWRKYAVGYTGEEVLRDGGFVRVPIILKDAEAVGLVVNGDKKELSFGYTCDFDPTPGKTPEGEAYDAVQRNLRGNHLAIVKAGRAGSECRIGDDNGDKNMTTKMVIVDGFQVETTDAGALAIDTLQKRVDAIKADNGKVIMDHATQLAAKDAEIKSLGETVAARDKALGEKDGEIAKLKAEASDAIGLDKLAEERADVLGKAKAIVGDGIDFKGKTNPEVRRMSVAKALGDEKVKDKSDDYVKALFDTLAENAEGSGGSTDTVDAIAEGMRGRASLGTGRAATDAAHAKMVKDAQDAWKNPGKAA